MNGFPDITQLKVLHAPECAAGQPACIARAQKKLGIQAMSLSVGPDVYNYQSDINYPGLDYKSLHRAFQDSAKKYDIYHFYAKPFYYCFKKCFFPSGMDILMLRAMGKTVIMHFRGSEVRFHSQFKKNNVYNYVDENPDRLTTKFPEDCQRKYYSLMKSLCHRILVPDPELQSYCPDSIIVPRAVDMDKWQFTGVSDKDVPLIVHAPSRRIVKGTHYIIEAVKKLRDQGVKFNFKLIENMPNNEAEILYREADIVIDQLRIGWYGVLTAECMALGKPVVCYIGDDLKQHLKPDPPLMMSSPKSLLEDLKFLIRNKQYRRELSFRARQYAEKIHSSESVARQLLDIYDDCRRNPIPIDSDFLCEYIDSHKYYFDTRKQILLAEEWLKKYYKLATTCKKRIYTQIKKFLP